jgi:hypothetical protein
MVFEEVVQPELSKLSILMQGGRSGFTIEHINRITTIFKSKFYQEIKAKWIENHLEHSQ